MRGGRRTSRRTSCPTEVNQPFKAPLNRFSDDLHISGGAELNSRSKINDGMGANAQPAKVSDTTGGTGQKPNGTEVAPRNKSRWRRYMGIVGIWIRVTSLEGAAFKVLVGQQ